MDRQEAVSKVFDLLSSDDRLGLIKGRTSEVLLLINAIADLVERTALDSWNAALQHAERLIGDPVRDADSLDQFVEDMISELRAAYRG